MAARACPIRVFRRWGAAGSRHLAKVSKAGRRIDCPVLALWSAKGGLEQWYRKLGGPLELWREWGDDVEGEPIEGGHFFPEEKPRETAARLLDFFTGPRHQSLALNRG